MKHQGGLVREDTLRVRPKPDGDKVLVLAGSEVDDAIDAPSDADDAPVLQVLEEELGRVLPASS